MVLFVVLRKNMERFLLILMAAFFCYCRLFYLFIWLIVLLWGPFSKDSFFGIILSKPDIKVNQQVLVTNLRSIWLKRWLIDSSNSIAIFSGGNKKKNSTDLGSKYRRVFIFYDLISLSNFVLEGATGMEWEMYWPQGTFNFRNNKTKSGK